MKLRLIREPSVDDTTLGSLYVNGVWECWTLEDTIRDIKIPGRTAIASGVYSVKLTKSPRFGVILPELLNVPDFVGVRIHAGNRKEDTDGCILVGQQRGSTYIGQSRLALEALMRLLVTEAQSISLTIENPEA